MQNKEYPTLRECPFCGSKKIAMRNVGKMFGKSAYERTYLYMECIDCAAQTGVYGTRPKTIEAWNRRVNNGR